MRESIGLLAVDADHSFARNFMSEDFFETREGFRMGPHQPVYRLIVAAHNPCDFLVRMVPSLFPGICVGVADGFAKRNPQFRLGAHPLPRRQQDISAVIMLPKVTRQSLLALAAAGSVLDAL